jgi:hypothetical protein
VTEFGNNKLTGTGPASLGSLPSLRYLALSQNQLTGLVPAALGNLGSSFTTLHLQGNNLSGPLPSSLSGLTAVQIFGFNNTSLCIPVDAALQAWLAAIPNLSSTNQPCAEGTVKIAAAVTGSGVQSPNVRFVDLTFSNTGTSHALRTTISSLTFRTLAGAGTVTLAGTLPIELPTIPPAGSTVIRLHVNVPSSVLRFSLTEGGTYGDVMGNTFRFSLSQSVFR